MKCLIDCRLLVPAKDCLCCVKGRPAIERPEEPRQVTNGDVVRMTALGINCTTPMPATDEELNEKFNELVVGYSGNHFPVSYRSHHQLQTCYKSSHESYLATLLLK